MSERKFDPTEPANDTAPVRFVGEEGEDTRSSPRKDLMASAVIGVISIIAMLLALAMPTQGSFYSAPGLLPFLVGASLLAMSVGLAIKALRRGAFRNVDARPAIGLSSSEVIAVPFLIGAIAIYIVALDVFTFDIDLPTSVFRFQFSSYELISVITLLILLKVFWRAALWRCFLVSAVWVAALASVFRYAFHILLPGSA